LVVPTGTPHAIIAKLNSEINAILQLPDIRKFLISQGAQIQGGTPEQFAAYIKSEIPKWAKVIRDSGARVD
jgi:tripartite-type tricarboxylate transporter receptor subunit TctC